MWGRSPKRAGIAEQGLGWKSSYKSQGRRPDRQRSGRLVDATPIKWDLSYLDMLFGNEWERSKSPAGAHQ